MKDGTISPHESHTYLFVPQAGGERVISAENANISVYEFSDGALSCCMTGQESVEMDFYAGKTYYVIFEAFDNNTTLQYFFKIGTTIEAGSVTTVSLQKGLNVLCVQADASGYYNIKVPVSSISIESGAEKRDAYTYSIFIASGAPSIIVVNNTGEDLSNVSLEVQAPNEIELLEKITISSSNSVGTFKNPYSYSVTYQLIADSTQGDPTVNIVNKEMESIASVSIEDNRRVYTFTLAAGESCYIDCVYNSQGTITLLLSVNQNQLKWKVDNAVYDSQKIILPRGHTYEIALLLYSQNHELGVLPNHFLIVEDNSQFTYHDGEITIRPTAQIGNNVVIRAHDYSEFTLQIVFAFDQDEFGFSVSNNEKIELTWSSPIGLKLIKFSVGTRAFSVSLNGGTSGKKDITSYIPAQMGTTPVSLDVVEIMDHNENFAEFVGNNEILVSNLFQSGIGGGASPYIISCERHFRNIGKQYTSVYVPRQGYENRITSEFKLVNNITLTGDWTPFEYKFSGSLDGNNCSITYSMHIASNEISRVNFGLFEFVVGAGSFKNLKLSNCKITSEQDISTSNGAIPGVGILAGAIYEAGTVESVKVINPQIEVYIKEVAVGGIAGSAYYSLISNCEVTDGNIISYDGSLGGMAGLGNIEYFHGGKVSTTLTRNNYEEGDLVGPVIGNSTSSNSVNTEKVTRLRTERKKQWKISRETRCSLYGI